MGINIYNNEELYKWIISFILSFYISIIKTLLKLKPFIVHSSVCFLPIMIIFKFIIGMATINITSLPLLSITISS